MNWHKNLPAKTITIFLLLFVCLSAFAQTSQTDDNERIDAKVKIHYTQNEYTPAKSNAYHIEKQEYNITGQLSCKVMSFRIETFKSDAKNRAKCNSASMHCPVLIGSSQLIEYDENGNVIKDVNFSLQVSVTKTTMDEKNGRVVTTRHYNAEGENNMDQINLEIKPYWAPEGQVQPLTPNYVIWLTGGIGFDFSNPRRKPTGNGKGETWDDWKQELVPMEGPFEIAIPSDFNNADHDTEINEVYEQLLIADYKDFDDYLLNPKGEFVLKKSGKRYRKVDGSQETEGVVEIEITFTPHITINDLKF